MSKLDLLNKLLQQVPTQEAQKALRESNPEKYAEYLKTLDEVYGPVATRQRQMGFDRQDYYHGTDQAFPAFSRDKLGSGETRNQIWTSNNPDVANTFAKSKGQNSLLDEYNANKDPELVQKIENALKGSTKRWTGGNLSNREIDTFVKLKELTPNEAKKIKILQDQYDRLTESSLFNKKLSDSGEQIYPLKIRRESGNRIDAQGQNWQDVKEQIGDKEVLVKNIQEDVRSPYSGESIAPVGDSYGVVNPNQLRSKHAAFDPRFKESDDLLALNKSEPGIIGKTLKGISYPQRYLMNKISEEMGLEGNIEDSEQSAQAIVEKLAEQGGLPEDSTIGNALKALGVAGLEVFGDPTNLIPGAAVSKGVKALGITKASKLFGKDKGKLLNNIAKAKKSTDEFEPAIKDIQLIKNMKQNPDNFGFLGSGMEKNVFLPLENDATKRVIKVLQDNAE